MSVPYMLNRDTIESKRLGVQHHLWVDSLGFHVHPRIEATLSPDAVIADVGTGTGAWLISLDSTVASSTPSPRRNWTYHGLDISAAQFPPLSTLSSNITLTAPFNLKDPIPPHLRGKFDLVHLRLLVLGLDLAEFHTAVANLSTMLKPTGWIQWDEIDIDSFLPALHSNAPDPTTAVIGPVSHASGTYYLTRGFNKFMTLIHPRGVGTMKALWGAMTDPSNGLDFATVGRYVVSTDRILENRAVATECAIGTFRGVAKRELEERKSRSGEHAQEKTNSDDGRPWLVDGMDMGPQQWTEEMYDEIVALMRQDVERGGYTNYKIWCCFGRKA